MSETLVSDPERQDEASPSPDLGSLEDELGRLRSALHERTRLVHLLQDLTEVANENAPLDDAVHSALARIAGYGGWEIGHLYWVSDCGDLGDSGLWFPKAGTPELAAYHPLVVESARAPEEGLPGRVCRSGVPAWISDLEEQPEAMGRDLLACGLRSAIAFPVLSGDQVVAVLEFLSSERIDPEAELLEVIGTGAAQLGRAIERARASRKLLELAVQEQQLLGEELHEGLGQQVAGLSMLAKSLRNKLEKGAEVSGDDLRALADRLSEEADGVRSQVRSLSKGLLPVRIDSGGLLSALEDLFTEVCGPRGLDCTASSPEGLSIPAETATGIYRIVREALNNAALHGHATGAEVRFRTEGDRLVVEVEDDGVGLDQSEQRREGLGLRIMRHRASLMNGELTIEAVPGGGTRVTCSVPAEGVDAD
jgi:signal transduction histidine kinase